MNGILIGGKIVVESGDDLKGGDRFYPRVAVAMGYSCRGNMAACKSRLIMKDTRPRYEAFIQVRVFLKTLNIFMNIMYLNFY